MKNPAVISLTTCLTLLLSSPAFADGHGKKGKNKGHMKQMFESTDINQDGQLDLSEFLAHAELRFKSMDLNQDGYVTRDEGRDAHRQMREKRKQAHKEKRKERRKSHDGDTN